MEKTPKNLLSERVNNLSESATIAMARKSRELKAQGIDVISLSLGEPDFNTPDFIKNSAIDAINLKEIMIFPTILIRLWFQQVQNNPLQM